MGQYSVFGAPKLLSFRTRPHVNVFLVSKHRTCRAFKSTTSFAERNTYDGLHLDSMAIDNTTLSLRQFLRRYMGHSSMAKTTPDPVMPQSGSRVAHFDFLFSTILNNFLNGATGQIQGKSQAMNEEMASIYANIACSPADSCALVQLALKSIPFSVKEAFGRPPWVWPLVGNTKEASQTTLDSATGVYAYHLRNINNQDDQKFYVGQTTRSFASRWTEHAIRRKATQRPKKFSSKFYENLKMTRPKDISILILADISSFQEDVVVHKHIICKSLSSIQYACRTMAGLEFCISTIPGHPTLTLTGRRDGYPVTAPGAWKIPCAFARGTGSSVTAPRA
ncbi:hypothetical protein BDR22DRAFT_964834 [Usnea florida]